MLTKHVQCDMIIIGYIQYRKKNNMTNFNDFLNAQLTDPELNAEYNSIEPEFAVVQALIDVRKKKGITQQQLAHLSGIAQGDISKIENGNANPSIKTLQRLAAAMDKNLKLNLYKIKILGVSQ